MNTNFTNKLFTLIIFTTFAIEHSLLFSIGCILYFTLQNITQQELESIMNLRKYISNSDKWIKQLHNEARNIGVPLSAPRNIFTGIWEELQTRFTPEQIESLQNDSFYTNKIVDLTELHFADENLDNWEEASLNDFIEDEMLTESYISFIKKFAPNTDFDSVFTQKDFRTTIKTLKAAMRNSDGSIKNELEFANSCIHFVDLQLQRAFCPNKSNSKEFKNVIFTSEFSDFLNYSW